MNSRKDNRFRLVELLIAVFEWASLIFICSYYKWWVMSGLMVLGFGFCCLFFVLNLLHYFKKYHGKKAEENEHSNRHESSP